MGTFHIATRDGEAMFFHDSIDFSSYAGTDEGDTPYRFVFTDEDGKIAEAWSGAAGGGEAFGSEKVTNGDFSAWTDPTVPDGWSKTGTHNASNYVAEDANGMRLVSDGTFVGIEDTNILVGGSLYKAVFYVFSVTSSGGFIDIGTAAPLTGIAFLSSGNYTGYRTPILPTETVRIRRLRHYDINDFVLSSLSVKPLTDVPITGLHLMSAKNGTTRNMAKVDTGFNPNAIIKVQIYG
jgi:hypothetical protein